MILNLYALFIDKVVPWQMVMDSKWILIAQLNFSLHSGKANQFIETWAADT